MFFCHFKALNLILEAFSGILVRFIKFILISGDLFWFEEVVRGGVKGNQRLCGAQERPDCGKIIAKKTKKPV